MNRYRKALDVQNASNISGVARFLVEVIDGVPGAQERRSDAAVVLVIAKLADLCGLEYVWPAHVERWCAELASAMDESLRKAGQS